MTIEEMARAAEAASAELVEWSGWRQCPTCRAASGEACFALNGRVAGGVPDGVRTPLPHPHAHRRRRVRR